MDAGASGQATTWVLTDALERSGLEVEAAKLWQRAQAASARDGAAAAPLTELLRERFGATRLVRQLMQPVGEAPKAGVAEDGAAPPAPTDGDHLDAMGALLAPPVDAEP